MNPTLLDQVKRTDPDGMIANIVEALSERNPILKDAVAIEGNLTTGHRTTIRAGLPSVGFRRINQGTASSKSTTIQVDETCGLLNGRSEVDVELARLGGNQQAFRASEERAFMQSLNITAADALMYASTAVNPEKIHGFTPRFDSLTGGNGDNVINFADFYAGAASATANRSIWFISWHEDYCHMIYPKGTIGGIESKDMGEQYIEDLNAPDIGHKFLAWVTEWNWRLGLAIRDWRYVVRICNIDPADSTGANNFISDAPEAFGEAMIEAYNRHYDPGAGRTVIYMPRQIKSYLERARLYRSNVFFEPMDWHGKQIMSFQGLPIVTIDTLNTDEVIVA